MPKTAKLFKNGGSQAVRLPADFCFSSPKAFIRKDPESGDVILSGKPASWDDLFALADSIEIPAELLASRDRRPPQKQFADRSRICMRENSTANASAAVGPAAWGWIVGIFAVADAGFGIVIVIRNLNESQRHTQRRTR